jgi:NAD(P)-dependent dehydrogenase (short-subunit alcohol dehydrogenase family)
MRLEGISAVVTGGASGLGLATTRHLLERGVSVTVADLPSSPGKQVAEELGDAARFVETDITDPDSVASLFEGVGEGAPLRAVVHCAGRGGDRIRILDKEGNPSPFESFENVIAINLFGTYNVLRFGAARIAKSEPADAERGAFVLTASIAAFDGQIGQTSYTASKAAVHGMTLVAARDLASRQIRVNTIAPGMFDTPMLARLRDDIREGLASEVPHPRRLGKPDEYAMLAVQALENPYLNGQTIRLDGAVRMPPR